ncbi:Protein CBG27356 [Caenorhabditis briggsae]|nr:Protein CBG27356 [Caenorhabditis briggsae]CAR98986.1 Protein CBG27356 [Caenorhabditis briggsae]
MCSKFQSYLQNQFFRALVVQSIGPTLFLVLPIAPILAVPLMSPYTGTEVSWQPGWLHSIVGLFPPFDSLAFMLIVKEYTKILKNRFGCIMSGPSVEPTSHPSASQQPINVL